MAEMPEATYILRSERFERQNSARRVPVALLVVTLLLVGVSVLGRLLDWDSTLQFLPVILAFGILIYIAVKQGFGGPTEVRYRLDSGGILVEPIRDHSPLPSKSISWHQVEVVEPTETAVVLHLHGGSQCAIPNTCFESEKQQGDAVRFMQSCLK